MIPSVFCPKRFISVEYDVSMLKFCVKKDTLQTESFFCKYIYNNGRLDKIDYRVKCNSRISQTENGVNKDERDYYRIYR